MIAALIGVLVLAMSAKAAAIAYWQAQATHRPVDTMPIGYEAQDHFPGAALLYAAQKAPPVVASAPVPDPNAAPGAGSTGTAELPPLPLPARLDLTPDTDGTVRPAQPFSMRGASAVDRARALECLSSAIYYEAASESDDGQRAVAQVILNRVRHPAFPSTVCGVVYQGSERAGCQFSYACDGSMARRPSAAGMARATRIAWAALNGYVLGAVGMATHYHTYAVTPVWNRSLVMTDAIGAHFFHRWKGYWGTPAAFSNARYRGGEPVPGPHARIAPLPVPTTPVPPLPGAQYAMAVPPTPTVAIQPKYQTASIPRPAPAPGDDALPGSGQILDRWKDSGKPLR